MKFAVMSDIHCNLLIFEMLVQDALKEGISKFLFLGDYVTDGCQGDKIIEKIKDFDSYAILGNREKYIKTFQEVGYELNYKLNCKALCYESLSLESLEYINSLDEVKIFEVSGYKILMIHGDGFNYNIENITNLYDKIIDKYDFDICLFGHTHVQKMDTYKDKIFINPGAVGQPLDGNGFSYCILEVKENKQPLITYKTIEINKNILNNDLAFREKNPEWSELIIASVINSFDFITLFMKFFNEDIVNYIDLTQEKYDDIFKEKYQKFANKYNIVNKI